MFRLNAHNRQFYRRVLLIAIPIIIQNGITNFVSLLDNIMVGQVGTLQMSGVSVANQLLLVFNLCVFGGCSGAGLFTAQFHGCQDHNSIRHTFRFKLLLCALLSLAGCVIFSFGGRELIQLYLQGEGTAQDAALTLSYGMNYMKIMLIGLLPFALTNAYASTLRECGQTVVPMAAGIAAVLTNLALNFVLIFGHLGSPAMGVQGAAIATVVSRFVELAVVAIWTHRNSLRHPFIRGAYHSLHIPKPLFLSILRKGFPLLVNEFMWSSGMAVLSQCYSTCGLEVVPATNISTTLQNLCSVVSFAMANSVGIIMGQMLGAGTEEKEVRQANRRVIALSILAAVIFGGVTAALSDAFPHLYNTTDSVRSLASRMICIIAIMMPFQAFTLSCYFTLRSGGQVLLTFLFDSCFIWVCNVPLAFCLSRFAGLEIIPLFICCQLPEFVRCAIGGYFVHKGVWIKNLTK